MWNTHTERCATLKLLPEYAKASPVEIYDQLFRNIRYVWMRRRDRADMQFPGQRQLRLEFTLLILMESALI